jgi:ubiquinone/menaquinone biosynthesis C-methylase UbiE
MSLYDRIGKTYDTTRHADPGIAKQLAHHLRAVPGQKYLDLACGTGNYAYALASLIGAEFHGVDQSDFMIRKARSKGDKVLFRLGQGENLPFESNTFAGATCVLALHHFQEIPLVFREIARVLKSGRFVIFTADTDQMRTYWLNEYFPKMMSAAINRMPTLAQVTAALKTAGFATVQTEPFHVTPDLRDLFLFAGKHRPEMYLDPRIRSGMSGFAQLAGQCEVDEGCRRLAADIDSGRIKKIIQEHENPKGEYLFVVAEKV